MEQTKKRFKSPAIGMILIAALVLGALFAFYFWSTHRGGIYARRAADAAAGQNWERAMALAEKADRNGETDTVKTVTYAHASALFQSGSYSEAKELFSGLKGYEDAEKRVLACAYALAEQAQAAGDYEAARDGFLSSGGYLDALTRADQCRYAIAEQLFANGDDSGAFAAFLELGAFEDANDRAAEIAVRLTGETDKALALLYAQGYRPEELDARERLETLRQAYAGHRVAAGHGHAVFLTDSGRVRFAGDETLGRTEIESWTDIIAVSAGFSHTLGLRSDGRVVAAGDGSCGQCDVSDWTDIRAIAAGPFDSYGLKADGTVVSCGYLSERIEISGWTDVIALAAGEDALFAVRKNGTLLGTGSDRMPDWKDLCAAAAAGYFPAGLDAGGSAHSEVRDLSDWTELIAIDGSATLLLGLRTDGTLRVLPLMPVSEALLSALEKERDVIGMSAAGTYVLLLHADGSVTAPGAPFDCAGLRN